mgnify:CR=1 FL=1
MGRWPSRGKRVFWAAAEFLPGNAVQSSWGYRSTTSPPTTEDPDGTSADELASDGTAAEGAR